jgi:hypothetical protein
MHYGDALGWDLPVFIEKDLFGREFFSHDERIVNMYSNLGTAMDKAFATAKADEPVLHFDYWRKISDKATKLKPYALKAELFMNPNYGIVWCLVSSD